MCNEISQRGSWKQYRAQLLGETEGFSIRAPTVPYGAVKISDPALVLQASAEGVSIDTARWGWPGEGGRRTIWLRAERRKDPPATRGIVPFDTFYEYENGPAPKPKWEFAAGGNEPMGMGVIVRDGHWALLTTAPGPDVGAVHDRQPAIVRLSDWLPFLTAPGWPAELVGPLPAGALTATRVR